LALNLIEIAPTHRTKKTTTEKAMKDETERINAAIPRNNIVIALDEKGDRVTTNVLTKKIENWMQQAQDISLVIGGADGLDDQFKNNANEIWSLSPMTLPHQLIRVIVVEQVYRAWSIMHNHPYHRE
jgi:23S rRNA (pseudouridine1915-N3)-methyltransferase